MVQAAFTHLSPDIILSCAESFSGLHFDGMITPYNSYVNRVFGLTDENGADYVIKFYRPGRWTKDAVQDEHDFLNDCALAEVPVIPPLYGCGDGSRTVGTYMLPDAECLFALFPRLRARTFDIYTDDDWIRTGRAAGRMHCAAVKRNAPYRLQCSPQKTTEPYISALLSRGLVTDELVPDFVNVCNDALDYIEDAFAQCFGEADADGIYHTDAFHRIHGDCHRGNILEQFASPSPADPDTQDTGTVTFIDFDDMMTGPSIQDLWLLLPGYRSDSVKEMNLLLEGYEEFMPFDRKQLRLIEPLRFMRNIYFLAWTAVQHDDEGFSERYPGWGTKAFWEKEIEDLRTQEKVLENEYAYFMQESQQPDC